MNDTHFPAINLDVFKFPYFVIFKLVFATFL